MSLKNLKLERFSNFKQTGIDVATYYSVEQKPGFPLNSNQLYLFRYLLHDHLPVDGITNYGGAAGQY